MKVHLLILSLFLVLLKVAMPLPVQASAGAHLTGPQAHRSQLAATEAGKRGISMLEPADQDNHDQAVYDDAEDEEASELFARKFTLIARNYPDFAFQCEPGSSLFRTTAPEYLLGTVNFRYILLCVLRV